jgi:hypothetical protein
MNRAAPTPERDRLNASIASARDDLAATLGELRGAVREQLDWRAWVRARPLVATVIAAAVGYRLGRGRWW